MMDYFQYEDICGDHLEALPLRIPKQELRETTRNVDFAMRFNQSTAICC